MNIAFLGLILVVVGFATIAAVIRRYRRCPSDNVCNDESLLLW